MSDLFGNHIVGFPTRRLNCHLHHLEKCSCRTHWLYIYPEDSIGIGKGHFSSTTATRILKEHLVPANSANTGSLLDYKPISVDKAFYVFHDCSFH